MDAIPRVSSGLFGVFCLVNVVRGTERCTRSEECVEGYCCGEYCCPYLYEMWWFWVFVSCVLVVWGCCLFLKYRGKCTEHRENNCQVCRTVPLSHQDRTFNFVRPPPVTAHMHDTSYICTRLPSVVAHRTDLFSSSEHLRESESRLPTYDEVQGLSTDPPAYEMLFDVETNMPYDSGVLSTHETANMTASSAIPHYYRPQQQTNATQYVGDR